MKVWTTTGFTGHYPVGCAAVVVAPDATAAAAQLNAALRERGLADDVEPKDMERLPTASEHVVILCDGNY